MRGEDDRVRCAHQRPRVPSLSEEPDAIAYADALCLGLERFAARAVAHDPERDIGEVCERLDRELVVFRLDQPPDAEHVRHALSGLGCGTDRVRDRCHRLEPVLHKR